MTTVLYFVKDGDRNEELRYSLRSLRNFPHDRVVIVGGKPRWVTGVEFHKANPSRNKWKNVYLNLLAACDKVGGSFVVMNDDIFFMEPTVALPSWHRGPLAEHIAGIRNQHTEWVLSLKSTLEHLRRHGHADPLSYEAHIPVEMDADKLGAVLETGIKEPHLPQWRTLYGNWWGVPAVHMEDVKIRNMKTVWDPSWPLVSTDDRTFPTHPSGKAIRNLFHDPSPYEVNRDRRQARLQGHRPSAEVG